MKLQEFRFTSRNGHTKLHAMAWIPNGEIKAMVHLCHGLNGYIARFDSLARVLAENGFLVFGHDVLGHGLSAEFQEDLGFFGPERGDDYVLGDLLILTRYMQEMYPNKHMIFLGHSMGSYFVRRFLFTWPDEVDAAILMGTTSIRRWRYMFNKILLFFAGFMRKERFRPKHATAAALHLLNRNFQPHRSHYDWVTNDPDVVREREKDPYSNFTPTLKLYKDLNHTLGILSHDEFVLQMRKEIPLLIMFGEEDPLGKFGAEPRRLASVYKQADIEFVSLRGYSKSRHELHTDKKRTLVQHDILTWLEACIEIFDREMK